MTIGLNARLPQTYETTVLHPDASEDVSWRFVVVPAASLIEKSIDLSKTSQKLSLTDRRNIKVSMLPFVIASMLSTTPADDVLLRAENLAKSVIGNNPVTPENPDMLRFAERLAFERLVPFEQSPLSGESLAGLASYGGDGEAGGLALVKDGEQSLVLAANRKGVVIAAPTHWFLSSSILERIFDWLRGK